MKKLLAILLTLALCMSTLASCDFLQNLVDSRNETVSDETTPDETTPDETTPDETTPDETTPDETTPDETTPDETTPDETTPDDTTTTDENGPVMPPKTLLASEIIALFAPTFDVTADCQEAIIRDVAATGDVMSINVIRSTFTNEGFQALDVDMVDGAKFETILLIRDDELVTLYWIPDEQEVRITLEKADEKALSALQKNATTGGGTLTMVQIGVERVTEVDNPNIGLCYVFKLSNGNAIVIDGGFNNALCAENIYKALAKLDIAKNDDGKYQIEAWIFTHGHGDHTGVIYAFSEYADRVDVSYFLYNLTTNPELSVEVGNVGVAGEEDFDATVKATFPNATHITPRVGLNYYFGNATVSMLYTPDVVWDPEAQLDYYNNSSMIFKVSGGGTAFLCMGDAGDDAAKASWSLFAAHAYESGVLQITHHGMTTGANGSHAWDNIKKIYEATGATTVALPLGTRTEDATDMKSSNGRWTILFSYPYNNNSQMSYIVRKGDAPTSNGYFNRELLNRLVATAETGHNYLQEMSAAYKNVKSLHGYNGINMIDNGAGILTYISCADKAEMATVFQFANGGVTVKKNEKLDDWLKLPEYSAIEVIKSIDPSVTVFESTFGAQEVILSNVPSKKNIVSAFTNAGFEALDAYMPDDVKFETVLFSNGLELVTLYWKPEEKEMRILYEKLDEEALAALAPTETTGRGEITVVQIGVERVEETDNPMIGMCYIIKLSNGNAIVIDGGANNAKCAENIYNTLSKLNVAKNAKGQYIVEAWIFTHGHSDHNGVLNAFANAYSQKVDVLSFIYQVPSNSDISATGAGVAGEAAFHALCKETYPNSVYINPKAGLNYYFGNAIITMLYTPDVLWSPENKITYYNDTSLIFRIEGGNTAFLCFGDAGELAASTSLSLFEETIYRSGLFQITHHGLTTQEGSGAEANGWDSIKKIYEATESNLVVLPMGETYEQGNRNGRYSVLFQYGYNGYHMSYIVNKDNAPFSSKYFNAKVFDAFIQDVETGSTRMQDEFGLGSYKTLYGYNGINMIDNGAGRITYIASRNTAPMVTVFSFANGEVTVVTNDELYDWLAEPTLTDSFESTFDSYMEVYTHAWDINLFVDKFTADGYTMLDIDMIEGARFQTIMLQNGESLITMYWFSETGDLRIAYETIQEGATAPLSPNEETGTGEILLAQIGVDVKEIGNIASTENNPNIGIFYLFKLSNGRAMIIDGGYYYQSNADNIYKALQAMDIAKDDNGRYIIEAWFFTHGHGDHNGATAFFFPTYGDQVTVNYFVYQIPTNAEISPTGAGYAGEAAFHELCKTSCPEAVILNPHAGVTYYFGNATVDMLHTPDIVWSHATPIPDYNDSGIIFKTYGGGVEGFLCMGDSCEFPATETVKNYDVSAFNSNIVQIAHHGLNTQKDEGHEWRNMKKIYEGATPEFAFLPMGVAKPNVRSGRWSVLCGWGYTGKQASFVINADDDAAGVDQAAWNKFVSGILDGSIVGETFLGYDGYNTIDNGKGMITYIHCSETAPMITVMSFKEGKVTVELNTEFHPWVEENTK